MKIFGTDTVIDLKNRFHEKYPLLQIRIYQQAHDHNEGSHQKNEVDDDVPLSHLSEKAKDGIIDIGLKRTVDQIETNFEDLYGLHVQVFRKSGSQWLQTSVTDHWTVQKHLEKATMAEK